LKSWSLDDGRAKKAQAHAKYRSRDGGSTAARLYDPDLFRPGERYLFARNGLKGS
jgi:hypothetical protein